MTSQLDVLPEQPTSSNAAVKCATEISVKDVCKGPVKLSSCRALFNTLELSCCLVQGHIGQVMLSIKEFSKSTATVGKRPMRLPAAGEVPSGNTLMWQLNPQAVHVAQWMPNTALNVTENAVLVIMISDAADVRSHSSSQQGYN